MRPIGSSTRIFAGLPSFDPGAKLDLTGWWRAQDYAGPVTSIWPSTPSLGTSGNADRATTSGGVTSPTLTGPLLKGITTVEFNGTTDSLLIGVAAATDFVSVAPQWTYSGLLFVRDPGSDLSSPWVNKAALADNAFGYRVGCGRSPAGSTTTGRFLCEDNFGGSGPTSALFNFGQWLSIQARAIKAAPNVMQVRINGGPFVDKPNPTPLTIGTHFVMGTFNGFVADQFISKQFFDDATLDQVRTSYYLTKYGVTV